MRARAARPQLQMTDVTASLSPRLRDATDAATPPQARLT